MTRLTTLLLALVATPALAGITLPQTVDPGAGMTVALDPPAGPGARLRYQPLGGMGDAPEPAGPALDGGPLPEGAREAEVTAPEAPGSYRVILEEGGTERDRATLEVVATATAGLGVPAEVDAGRPMRVTLPATARLSDRLEIRDAGGAVVAETLLSAEAAEAGTLRLDAPGSSGTYRLLLLDGHTGKTGAEARFTVDATEAFLAYPTSVAPGGTVEIVHHGPGGSARAIELRREGRDTPVGTVSLAASSGVDGRVQIAAPSEPGRYRLRYLDRSSGEVLSDTVLIVAE